MTTTKLQALNDYLVLKRLPKEEFTPGGLLKPQSGPEFIARGEVLAAPIVAVEQRNASVGDLVLFPVNKSIEVEHDAVKYTLVRLADALAFIPAEKPKKRKA